LGSKVRLLDKVLSRIGRLDRDSVQGYVEGLVRQRQEAEEILDQIDEGILLVERSGLVRYANRRAFLSLGFQRFYKDRSQAADLAGDPAIREFLRERLSHPERRVTEEFQVLEPRELSLRIHWIPLEVEGEAEALVRIEDITQERSRNDDDARVKRIEGLIRLAGGVAHEIGNPLNSIQIHLELLKRECEKLPQGKQGRLKKLIDVITAETRRLDDITRSFLKATRRPPLRFRKESVNAVLRGAVDLMRPELAKNGVRARVTTDEGLSPFLIDPERLRQALINLVKNAVEAMPKGGELRISTKGKERVCLIRFEDQGVGIDENDLPHIFEAYYTTKNEGSGLGLAQVYETVREHGGRIDVKSERGKGTVFTIALPVREEKLSLPQPKEASERAR
jgi:signal transduction histidine kinase